MAKDALAFGWFYASLESFCSWIQVTHLVLLLVKPTNQNRLKTWQWFNIAILKADPVNQILEVTAICYQNTFKTNLHSLLQLRGLKRRILALNREHVIAINGKINHSVVTWALVARKSLMMTSSP